MFSRSISIVLPALALLAPAPAAPQATERLYQEACDAGDLTACNVFGLMHETGQGVPRDLARAATLYRRACQGGALVGCTNIGLLLLSGIGVSRDSVSAAGFFRVACEGGEQLGCGFLGAMNQTAEAVSAGRHAKVGRVGDVGTNRALSEALVELPALGVRVISDANGSFVMSDVPEGRHAIRAERLGYEPLVGFLEVPGDPNVILLMTPAEITDPSASGQVVGRVLEGGGRALTDVDVGVVDQERARTLTNQQGRFTIRDVAPGLVVVRFARLGYAPRSATLVVQPGRTAEISVALVVEPIELEPVEVSIRSLDLERDGFYARAAQGWGTHFAPGDIERIQPITVGDLFRGRVPGVRVAQVYDQSWGSVTRLFSRRGSGFTSGSCVLPVYLDGILMSDNDVDRIPAEAVVAAEVFQGSNAPIQYRGWSNCGAVLLWTRRGN